MSHWIYVAAVDKIAVEQLMTFRVQDEELLVYRAEDHYYVYANRCPHQEVPLSNGYLVKGTIVCRLHGAKFDLQTGVCLRAPAYENLHAYAAEVRNGQLYINPNSLPPGTVANPMPMTFRSRKDAITTEPTSA